MSGLRALAWAGAGALAAWAVLRGLALDRRHPLVALVSFTPHVAAAGAVVVVALAGLRQWRPLAVAAAALAVLGALVLPRAFGSAGEPRTAPRLRVLTANVAVGQVPVAALVGLVAARDVDVLAVQELTPAFEARLQRAGIGRRLPHAVTAPVADATGTGLYARLPLEEVPGPRGSVFAQVAARTRWAPAGELELVSVHLPPPISAQHVGQWHEAFAGLPGGGAPRLLLGDFNATLDHRELRRLLGRGYTDAAAALGGGLRATYPANRGLRPGIVIDHALSTGELRPARYEVLALPRGDHRALYVEYVPR